MSSAMRASDSGTATHSRRVKSISPGCRHAHVRPARPSARAPCRRSDNGRDPPARSAGCIGQGRACLAAAAPARRSCRGSGRGPWQTWCGNPRSRNNKSGRGDRRSAPRRGTSTVIPQTGSVAIWAWTRVIITLPARGGLDKSARWVSSMKLRQRGRPGGNNGQEGGSVPLYSRGTR